MREKDPDEWVRVEDTHEALISRDDFQSVQRMMGRDRRSAAAGTGASGSLFSGFLFCADCGQPMVRKASSCGGKSYCYYTCSTHKRGEGCSTHSISFGILEKAVIGAIRTQVNVVLDLAETMEYLETLPDAKDASLQYESQIHLLEGDIDRYRLMKLRLYESLSEGVIGKEDYAEFREQYEAMIADKTAALERVRRAMRDASLHDGKEKAWAASFREHKNFEVLERRVLMALVDRILVHENHGVEVVFLYRDECRGAADYVKKNEKLIHGREG